MMFRKIALPFALVASLALGACGSVASFAASTAANMSTSVPSQVKTLSEAYIVATAATNAVDVYVNLAHPDRAVLIELRSLNNQLHAALTDLNAANDAHKSLYFAAFNEALTAFNAYRTTKGIKS